MSGLDEIRATFFEECAELLGAAAEHLAEIAEGTAGPETLHAIFRAVHSIKGGAGAFGFSRLVRFAHSFETLLDCLRDGRLVAGPALAGLLLRANDALSDLIAAEQRGVALDEGFGAEIVRAMDAEASPVAGGGASPRAPTAPAPAAMRAVRIRFAPRGAVFRNGNEPALIIAQLRRLGPAEVSVDCSRLPALAALDPEEAYLSWTIALQTTETDEQLREIFEFVIDDCLLEIAPDTAITEPISAEPGPTLPKPAEPRHAEEPAARTEAKQAAPGAKSIRVDIDKVDRLVNLVGELVITQAVLLQQSETLSVEQHADLIRGIEGLSQHARELQESVMAIRAQPVKSVFQRIPRLVRDLADELGKNVRLVTTGEHTEIDKTVIEQLGDPLTHMIRNAIDHGIERPEDRVRAGKQAQGTIHLSAEHRSGRILIEIADDGRGINREQVRRKAEARGLIPPGANMSEDEVTNLIFLPGFSTAETVSNVSGRGVGMDVVKRNVQSMGGRLHIESRHGAGSRFVMSLPLTLAVLDGMVVAVGTETYIVPLSNIVESLRPRRGDIHPLVGAGEVLSIRGEYVPLIPLHETLSVCGAVADPCQGIVVIVEGDGGKRLALVVDELLGQQQVVVKSIEANYEPIEGIGGATILGNGRVALILDVSRLRRARIGPDRIGSDRMAARANDAAISASMH